MARVKILYKDGGNSYGELYVDREVPCIAISGVEYDLETFAATEATVAVNDPEAIKVLHAHGVNARPTPNQYRVTISMSESLRNRLVSAAKEDQTTVTGILTKLAEKWLEDTGR